MFEYLVFREGYAFQGDREVRIEVDGKGLRYRINDGRLYRIVPASGNPSEGVYRGNGELFISRLEAFGVPGWKDRYHVPATDGYWWNLRYKEVGKPCRKISGSNDSPDCFDEFVSHVVSIAADEPEAPSIVAG